MDLSTTKDGERSVVSVTGEVDVHTAPVLRDELERLFGDGETQVAVELDGVEFMDSTGLAVLIAAHQQAGREGGSFEVRTTAPRLLKLLRISGLMERLTIVPVPANP